MELSITLDIKPAVLATLQQMVSQLTEIAAGTNGSNGNGAAPHPNPAAFSGFSYPVADTATVSDQSEHEAGDQQKEQTAPQPTTIGAVPPGAEPPKRRGRQPTTPEGIAKRAAKEAAEAAAALAAAAAGATPIEHTASPPNGAVPPGSALRADPVHSLPGAVPPGMNAPAPRAAAQPLPSQPAMPQNPAMPPSSMPAYADPAQPPVSYDDFKAVHSAAVSHDPIGTNTLLRATTWPGTSEPKPPWFLVDKIPAVHHPRLYAELAAMLLTGA